MPLCQRHSAKRLNETVFREAVFIIIKNHYFYSATKLVTVLESGLDLTMELISENGWDNPFLVMNSEGLEMKMPPKDFDLKTLVDILGKILVLYRYFCF